MEKLKTISISSVKGVGEKTLARFKKLNINTVYDLLTHFPYRYSNYQLDDLSVSPNNSNVTVTGEVVSRPFTKRHRNNHSLQFTINSNDTYVNVVLFNRGFLAGRIKVGSIITVSGKYSNIQIIGSKLFLNEEERNDFDGVYSLGDMPNMTFKTILNNAFSEYIDYVEDNIPFSLQEKYKLVSIKDALKFCHFPNNKEEIKQSHRRIKYEELLKYQLKLQYLHKLNCEYANKEGKVYEESKLDEFIKMSIPFDLTNDQQKVINEILTDMKSDKQMYRLLQGDVGSGKTIVATIVLYANFLAGYQGAMMAPTEILAEQHFNKLSKYFKMFNLKLALLTSNVTGKERLEILNKLKSGEINMLIGTHALISDIVDFYKLGIVITDEQHRFGVNQRKKLREKALSPDVLFMTATPIPRTLAITVFGDMDVSTIREMPAGRIPIKSYYVNSSKNERVLNFIGEEISKDNQAYVITPLIEESEKMDLQNAMNVYESLIKFFNGKCRVGLLHGKLKSTDKDRIMKKFTNKEIDILVSTTVVEVGVDVPDATIMYILDAHRFGLSQLHQLRGRVGRSNKQAYCIVSSNSNLDKSKERLKAFVSSSDGFDIAEYDLRLRGPGDFFGTRQSGVPKFKIADIINDFKILIVAKDDAKDIINSNEIKSNSEYNALNKFIEDVKREYENLLD